MAYQGNSPNLFLQKKIDSIVFDGTSTTYPLTANGNPIFPAVAETLLISLNGVLQESQSAYTVSGSNISFSEAPAIGTEFFGLSLGEKVLISGTLPASGGTMTGLLTLVGSPISNLHAAPKQYVDQTIAAGDFVTRTGAQTMINKTIESPVINSPTITEDVLVISTNTTAVRSKCYVLTASLTLTLPASPAAGWKVSVVNRSGTTNCIVGRNGQNIMGLAEDMTLDATSSFDLLFVDATRGWVII